MVEGLAAAAVVDRSWPGSCLVERHTEDVADDSRTQHLLRNQSAHVTYIRHIINMGKADQHSLA